MSMNPDRQPLIDGLAQRLAEIHARQAILEPALNELRDLQEERQRIEALLVRYRVRQPSMPCQGGALPLPRKLRQTPGETAKRIDSILGRGETHSVVSLVRRIYEVFNIHQSDSTVGVILRRGDEAGKYCREGSLWSLSQP